MTLAAALALGAAPVALLGLVALLAAVRTGHGRGAGVPRVEVMPADELPAGMRAPARAVPRGNRDAHGRLAPGPETAALARVGGLAKAERDRLAAVLANTLGLGDVGEALAPYLDSAIEFAEVHMVRLGQGVGGGEVGPAPASMVQSAAIALAASRWAYAVASRTGDAAMAKLGSTLANDSRQNLLAAHELAAREATARPARHSPHLALAAALAAAPGPPAQAPALPLAPAPTPAPVEAATAHEEPATP